MVTSASTVPLLALFCTDSRRSKTAGEFTLLGRVPNVSALSDAACQIDAL